MPPSNCGADGRGQQRSPAAMRPCWRSGRSRDHARCAAARPAADHHVGLSAVVVPAARGDPVARTGHRRRKAAAVRPGRRFLFLPVPLAYAAIELFEPALRDRPKATQFPGQRMADLVTEALARQIWHAAPLRRRYGIRRQQCGGLFAGPAPCGGAWPAAIESLDRHERSAEARRGDRLGEGLPDSAHVDEWRRTFPGMAIQPPLVCRGRRCFRCGRPISSTGSCRHDPEPPKNRDGERGRASLRSGRPLALRPRVGKIDRSWRINDATGRRGAFMLRLGAIFIARLHGADRRPRLAQWVYLIFGPERRRIHHRRAGGV